MEHQEHPKNDRGGAPHKRFTVSSPLWGKCYVLPRDADPVDAVAMGYVALEGDADNLKLAIWKADRWLKPNLKPFSAPVSRSYYVEKADGSPIF